VNRSRLALIGLLAAAPFAAHAQRVSASMDLGGSQMRYADSINATAATFTPLVTVRWPRATLGATGSLSQLTQGAWTSQGTLSLSGWRPLGGPFSAELGGSAGGSAHHDGARTGQIMGTARLYASASKGGGWMGAALGSMNDGIVSRGVRQAEVGAWLAGSQGSALLSATPTWSGDSTRYTDIQGLLQRAGDRVDIALSLGTRTGTSNLSTIGGATNTWGSISLVGWLTPRAGVTLAGGTYPVDLTQGYPGGRFATLGVRLRWHSPGESSASTGQEEPAARAGDGGPIQQFRVERITGGRRVLRVHAPSAQSVELSGDFTSWTPQRLTNAGSGWWSIEAQLAPGVHQLNVRVDGGRWLVPPGLNRLTDEFGGVVGLLIVE
jgi:hypothetical protein